MKIITDNSAAIAVKPAYPQNYTCPFCTSVIQIENKADIKDNIPAFLVDAKSLKAGTTVPAIGFVCPVCGGNNILG